jgi:hypothetical protein
MEYRGIEYSVVQGIGRNLWKWSVSVANVTITGKAHSKSTAMVEAEKAIDRAFAPKKARLVPPPRRWIDAAAGTISHLPKSAGGRTL